MFSTGVLNAPMLSGPNGPVNPDVKFGGNHATNRGGGVFFDANTVSKLNAAVFDFNSVGADGGGFAVSRGTVSLTGGQVTNNQGANGAGGYVDNATVSADGVSFQGNIDLANKLTAPVAIGSTGILNTTGCFFNGNGLPIIIAAGGVWNSTNDTP